MDRFLVDLFAVVISEHFWSGVCIHHSDPNPFKFGRLMRVRHSYLTDLLGECERRLDTLKIHRIL